MQHWRIYGGLEAAYEVDDVMEKAGIWGAMFAYSLLGSMQFITLSVVGWHHSVPGYVAISFNIQVVAYLKTYVYIAIFLITHNTCTYR